jgi:flavin reductase (DIM6/NTAB) family NADH-FMN oxidoreductase RutF
MFYQPSQGHPFQFDPFKAIVAPRPIGWISTVDVDGKANLAPYSFFNAVAARPPVIAFSSEGLKHSAGNARATGEFAYNVVARPDAEAMNLTSLALSGEVSEFDYADVGMAPCRTIAAPRVASSPATLECKVTHFFELQGLDGRGLGRYVIIGQVVGVHIADRFIVDGRFDAQAAQTIARCGYNDYLATTDIFEMTRPEPLSAGGN